MNGSGRRELPGPRMRRALALLPSFLVAPRFGLSSRHQAALVGKVSEEARFYQRQALSICAPASVLIGGLSGSGKTTLALKRAGNRSRAGRSGGSTSATPGRNSARTHAGGQLRGLG